MLGSNSGKAKAACGSGALQHSMSERRGASDGQLYTADEFKKWYGMKKADVVRRGRKKCYRAFSKEAHVLGWSCVHERRNEPAVWRVGCRAHEYTSSFHVVLCAITCLCMRRACSRKPVKRYAVCGHFKTNSN